MGLIVNVTTLAANVKTVFYAQGKTMENVFAGNVGASRDGPATTADAQSLPWVT